MTELLELANRCERAIGPDRELDYEICEAVTPFLTEFGYNRLQGDHGWYSGTPAIRGSNKVGPASAYTGSIDAALLLIPEGWFFEGLNQRSPTVRVWTEGNKAHYSPQLDGFHAATPALALCAAALRARALP